MEKRKSQMDNYHNAHLVNARDAAEVAFAKLRMLSELVRGKDEVPRLAWEGFGYSLDEAEDLLCEIKGEIEQVLRGPLPEG